MLLFGKPKTQGSRLHVLKGNLHMFSFCKYFCVFEFVGIRAFLNCVRTFSFLSHFSLNKFANFFADYLISKHVSYVIDLYHHIKEMKGEGSQRPQNQYILGKLRTSVGIVLRCIPMTAVSQCQVLQIWKFREYILDQSQGNSVFNTQSLQPSLQYIYQVKKLI